MTEWIRPCHSRTSRAPGFKRGNAGFGVDAPPALARIGGGRGPCETLPRPLRQPAQFEFLQTIRQGSHEQIAADARRLRAKEPSPFLAQRRAVELLQSIEARRSIAVDGDVESPGVDARAASRAVMAQRRSLCGLCAGRDDAVDRSDVTLFPRAAQFITSVSQPGQGGSRRMLKPAGRRRQFADRGAGVGREHIEDAPEF